ncbi:acyltransferase [Enterococcus thailandicus]|uniref:acyltransferase n=1 Tax=Enterococcus thailandicus TaxID=417368 RepID=UPI00288CA93A|nr:acyltransferase [Enterococcus thailandicus]MDT2751912.1 acyltransferase [Enterococcus thailandicus]MDT2776053.1 acyltransferase [Enterococcus thailandicus]
MDYFVRNINKDRVIGKNTIYAADVEMVNSTIMFRGDGNILFIEKGTQLKNVSLKFLGDNSIIYISKSRFRCPFHVNIYHDSVFYLGKNNSINGERAIFQLSEYKNIFIGDDNMFSFGVSIRVADPHLIYSTETMERINDSKSVYIGDHVWIGQNVSILKGAFVGSGSIIAGDALLTKKVPSNTIFGGSPAKKIKTDIFWLRPSVHAFKKSDTQKWNKYEKDNFIYKNEDTYSFESIESNLSSLNPNEKLEFLKELPTNKNRFFIENI